MKIIHRKYKPKMDTSACIAPTAVLVRKIKVGTHSQIMYSTVMNSETSTISINACCIVCKNTVIKTTKEGKVPHPITIDDHVFIEPHSTILNYTLTQYVYITIKTTILQKTKVGPGSVIAVGALVHANAVVPEGTFVPPHNVAIGDPAKIYAPSDENLITRIRAVGFPTAAFGIRPDPTDRLSVCRGATEVRSKEFEAHLSDEIID